MTLIDAATANGYALACGDCRDVLRTLPDNSVDSIVTDPPYELGFMGKAWDSTGIAYDVTVWRECLRVLKPGGHLLAFGGSRTYHRLACAVEDAGFEIRDQIQWVYAQGFPKSHNIGCKCNDAKGTESHTEHDMHAVRVGDVSEAEHHGEGRREILQPVVPQQSTPPNWTEALDRQDARAEQSGVEGWGYVFPQARELQADQVCQVPGRLRNDGESGRICDGTSPCDGADDRAPAEARGGCSPYQSRPAGQPAREFATVSEQRSAQARGGEDCQTCEKCGGLVEWAGWGTALKPAHEPIVMARKPLTGTVADNVQTWGTGAINVDACRVGVDGGTRKGANAGNKGSGLYAGGLSSGACDIVDIGAGRWPSNLIHDGSDEVVRLFPNDAARFYYCSKASKRDRDDGLEDRNTHATVKPTDIMRYLCRLVTPAGGIVLDPFAGSGSTGKAAILEGFRFIGIELDPDHVAIAEARIAHAAPDAPVPNVNTSAQVYTSAHKPNHQPALFDLNTVRA